MNKQLLINDNILSLNENMFRNLVKEIVAECPIEFVILDFEKIKLKLIKELEFLLESFMYSKLDDFLKSISMVTSFNLLIQIFLQMLRTYYSPDYR